MASTAASAATTATPSFFESVYADAAGDITRVPWCRSGPHPALVNWLNAIAPSVVRCGARVNVVGCGLGYDARELMKRGYDVLAFDCSETAIKWAQSLDAAHADRYVQADLFNLPPRWRHRFDLVVEVNTLQSLLPDQRPAAMQAMAEMMSRHGHLLAVALRAEGPVDLDGGPPWPVARDELIALAEGAGLNVITVDVFDDDGEPPKPRLRALFGRAG